MVTNKERRLVIWLCKLRIWKPQMEMRIVWIQTPRLKWLHKWLLKRQKVDDLHHAPACPANHYHKQRLVFFPCSCGAAVNLRKRAAGGGE